MEISFSWQVQSKDSTLEASDVGVRAVLSPDGKTICKANQSSVEFITKEKTRSLGINLKDRNEITCIETVFTKPWTLCVGTKNGEIHFFTEEKELTKIDAPIELTIQKIRRCSYKESKFTVPSPSLLIEYSPEMVIIPLDSIKNRLENSNAILTLNKWLIDHPYTDAVLINSNFQSPIVSGIHEFPAVYTIDDSPFFAVSSVAKPATIGATEFVKKSVTKFLRWVSGAETPKQEEIPKASYQWDLNDEGRTSRSIDADPTGRWIAISDAQGRVSIVDSVFGHIVKVLKGLRDSQVAWAESSSGESILIIYAPFRRMIIACTAPNGDIIDAVKCESGGKLIQTYDKDGKFGFAYIDPKKTITTFSIKTETKTKTEDVEYAQFSFPSFLLAEESEAVQKSWMAKTDEERVKAASLCKNSAEADAVIRSALAANASDEIILEIIDSLRGKFMKKLDDSSAALKEFWNTNDTSNNQLDSDLLFATECKLADIWRNTPKRKTRKVDVNLLPKTRITQLILDNNSRLSDILSIKQPPFSQFLKKPISSKQFFFDFASGAKSIDDYYAAFRVSRADKDEFVTELLNWCLIATPSELALAQTTLSEFLLLPKIRDILFETNDSLGSDNLNELVIALIANTDQ